MISSLNHCRVQPRITSEASNFKNMIGSFNTLQVVKRVAFGLYLDGEEMGEILLPNRYVPDNAQIGDYLKIMYAKEEILYIPLSKFSTIRKYVSREGAVPRLSRIGGKDWSNTKQKIKEKVDFWKN